MNNKLTLIADPLCGWCFGADPLLTASRTIPGLDIELHCGGLFSGDNRRPLEASMRQFILGHHERIEQLTGQEVGAGFMRLLDSGQAMLDSTPPIRGILAAASLGAEPLDYYQALIKAHFIDGRAVTQTETLQSLAAECGVDESAFNQTFNALDESRVNAHIFSTRRLMQQHGAQGFPTFILQSAGHSEMINHYAYYNNPTAWKQALSERIQDNPEQSVL